MSYIIDTPVQFGSGNIKTPGLSISSVVKTDASNNLTTGTVSLTTNVSGTLPVANGGTGTTSAPTNGQTLVGSGGVYTPTTISSGAGITVTSGAGSIQISNTGVTSISGTTNQVSASASTGSVTLSTPSVFIAPGTIQDTSGMYYSTSTGVAAAGTTQGTATALTKSYNEVTSVASNTGVRLPVPSTGGLIVTVVNRGVNTLNIYPASGGTIDSAGANVAVTLASSMIATYQATTTTQWYSTVRPLVAGTGISVSGTNGQIVIGNTGVTSVSGTANQITVSPTTGAVTASTPSTFVAPGTIQDTTGMYHSTSTAISAAGANQGAATALTKSYNEVTTVGSGTGVRLPVPSTGGLIVTIVNRGANTLNVYPASGGAIDSAGTNIAVTMPVNSAATYQAATTTQWYSTTPVPVAGSGLTVTYGNGQYTYSLQTPVSTANGGTGSSTALVNKRLTYTNSNQIVEALGLLSQTGNDILSGSSTYAVGTASQSGTFVTGSGTTFTSQMMYGVIVFNNLSYAWIEEFVDAQNLRVDVSQAVGSQAYTIYYGGVQRARNRFGIFRAGINNQLNIGPIPTNVLGGLFDTKINIAGTNSSLANTPSINHLVSDRYPALQTLVWDHDDQRIYFDSFWDGFTDISSSSTSNYRFRKNAGLFKLQGASVTAGSLISSWGDILSTTSAGLVTIGPSQTTFNSGRLNVTGTDSNFALGPHMRFYTSGGQYPTFEALNYTNGSTQLMFDASYNGSYISSYASGNYLIGRYATTDLNYLTNISTAAGSAISWNIAARLTPNGTTQQQKVVSIDNSSYSTGTVSTSGSSTTVTGSGTSWSNVLAGGLFTSGNSYAMVKSVISTTSLTLDTAVTLSAGSSYSISYNGIQSARGVTTVKKLAVANGRGPGLTPPPVSISGADLSYAGGPGINFYTTLDEYTRFQILPFSEGNVSLTFGGGYDGTNWVSSDPASNFQIYQLSGNMLFNAASGYSKGSTITWTTLKTLTPTGFLANYNYYFATATITDTFTVPSTATFARLSASAGGGGGGGSGGSSRGGGGGGSGAMLHQFPLNPGDAIFFTIGSGGSGGASGTGNAGNNTTLWIDRTYLPYTNNPTTAGFTLVLAGGSGGINGTTSGVGGAGGILSNTIVSLSSAVGGSGGNGGDFGAGGTQGRGFAPSSALGGSGGVGSGGTGGGGGGAGSWLYNGGDGASAAGDIAPTPGAFGSGGGGGHGGNNPLNQINGAQGGAGYVLVEWLT